MLMTCDNDCTRAGWIEAEVSNLYYDLHISHAPDADLDGRFAAFDHDEQGMIWLNGWMIETYERIAG